MKKFKKLLGFAALLAMTLCLCACLDDDYDDYTYEDDEDYDDNTYEDDTDYEDDDEAEEDDGYFNFSDDPNEEQEPITQEMEEVYDDDHDDYTYEDGNYPPGIDADDDVENRPGFESPASEEELAHSYIVQNGLWYDVNEEDLFYRFYDDGTWERYSDSDPSFNAEGTFLLCGEWVKVFFNDGSDPVWQMDFDTGVYSGELGVLYSLADRPRSED